MKTTYSLSLCFLLLACSSGEESAQELGAAAEFLQEAVDEAEAAAEAEPEPEGPVFRATVMGMEMTRPLVPIAINTEAYTGLTITAPEGATVSESRGRVKVLYAGLNYSMSINRSAFDAEQSKGIWATIDEAGSVIHEGEGVVMYQRSGDAGSVLFAASVMVGEEAYTCGSVASAMPFTRNQVDQMVESCRSLVAGGS